MRTKARFLALLLTAGVVSPLVLLALLLHRASWTRLARLVARVAATARTRVEPTMSFWRDEVTTMELVEAILYRGGPR